MEGVGCPLEDTGQGEERVGTYKVNKSARKHLINKDKSRAKTKKGITGGKMKKNNRMYVRAAQESNKT